MLMVVSFATRPDFQVQVFLVFSFATHPDFQVQVLVVVDFSTQLDFQVQGLMVVNFATPLDYIRTSSVIPFNFSLSSLLDRVCEIKQVEWTQLYFVIVSVRTSEFGPTDSLPSSKRRKLDDILSLESSHIGLSKDEPKEDLFNVKYFKSSSEVGSSGSSSASGDDDSSSFEGSDRPFILSNDWEVNKHYSSLSGKRLLKIQSKFQIPHNVPTRLAKVGE